MKIISKFIDIYDYAVAPSYSDDDVIYNRITKEFFFDYDRLSSDIKIWDDGGDIDFVAVRNNSIVKELIEGQNNLFVEYHIKGKLKDRKKIFFFLIGENLFSFWFKTYYPSTGGTVQYIVEKIEYDKKGFVVNPIKRDSVNSLKRDSNFFFDYKKKEITQLLKRVKRDTKGIRDLLYLFNSPLIAFSISKHYNQMRFITNFRLIDYHLTPEMLDDYELTKMYMDIENVLLELNNPERNMVDVSNQKRIEKHGFNHKYAFRKEPTGKKK